MDLGRDWSLRGARNLVIVISNGATLYWNVTSDYE